MKKKISIRFSVFLILLFMIGSAFYSLPYYVSKPGMAKELDPIIEVENGTEEEGNFMLTTVRMGRANIYSYLVGKLRDYYEIIPVEDVRSKEETEEEYNLRQLHLMKDSKLAAIEVAYKKAGLPIEYEYEGVYVLNVIENMPADGKLLPGDRIIKVDNLEFKSSKEFIDYVGKKKEGDEITLTYKRKNKVEHASLKIKAFKDVPEKVGVGIGLVDDKEIHVKPSVTIDSEEIGGPSAGLMFALEIYNQLVKEDLTRGYQIAGTGTISSDGKVGPIGGIDQKVVAADKANADIFFAPNEEGKKNSDYEIAVKTAKEIHSDMKIIPVATFDEAVAFLKELKPRD